MKFLIPNYMKSWKQMHEVMEANAFEYLAGTVDGEVPNGSRSREGHDYLWFQHGGKSILSHRFIVAVTLGKWAPRDFDVDHVNHNPSDNRPLNLRVVTRKDNAGNRRTALLSELADLDGVALSTAKREQTIKSEPVIIPRAEDELAALRPSSSGFTTVTYTGETKPAEHSNGVWRKTNLGSWHLHFDEAPRLKSFQGIHKTGAE